jgi:hypothetical protein
MQLTDITGALFDVFNTRFQATLADKWSRQRPLFSVVFFVPLARASPFRLAYCST